MHPNKHKIKGIAARAGHWSTTHRKVAIFGWLGFVVLALVVGSAVGVKQLTDADYYTGESGRAERVLDRSFSGAASESVLVQSQTLTVDDPEFRSAIAYLESRLERQRAVKKVETPLTENAPISRDRHSALVEFEIRGDPEQAEKKIDPVIAQVNAAQRSHPGLRIEQFGDASADTAINDAVQEDLHKAETLSLPITLAILLIAFGALVAAGIPLLLALSAVAATIGLVAIPSQLFPVDDAAASVVLLIGMAVGVDYSLFYMRREREERASGHDPRSALARASQTSGRAVLVSGLTVMAAMAGMFLAGDKGFVGIGLGTMMVVGVAMIGSLTVLPAMMAWLGDRVEKGRVPFVAKRRRRTAGQSRLWGAIMDRVLRRPAVSALVATAALVALAVPALGLNLKVTSPSDFPQDLPVVQAYNDIQKAFPGDNVPAAVVVDANRSLRGGEGAAAIRELKREALASDELYGPIDTEYSRDGRVAVVSIPVAGDGTDGESKAALAELRKKIVPAAVGKVTGAHANVTGLTAETVDQGNKFVASMPIVFGFVLTLAFLLLLVTFRSIVIPIKAIALNLLSVGAAYGVLALVFQHGIGASLIGAHATGGVPGWLPLFLFVVLFGLSMDYHVFILSRIREAVDKGMKTEDAVSHGIKSTAGVVTSAAIVMVAVFSIFATLSLIDMKAMGVGLAVAILIDATVVRAVLLPTTMTLLGEWNWYLPKSLGWLPHVKHEPAPEPVRA